MCLLLSVVAKLHLGTPPALCLVSFWLKAIGAITIDSWNPVVAPIYAANQDLPNVVIHSLCINNVAVMKKFLG